MGELTKPPGLSQMESWAWDNAAPESWARRSLAWGKALERQPKAKRSAWEAGAGWEGPGPEPPEWVRRVSLSAANPAVLSGDTT